MSYFICTSKTCQKHPKQWDALAKQIHKRDPNVSCALEVKALHVFTMARRLIWAARQLAKIIRKEVDLSGGDEWKPVFVEATSLLFPMIELVGHARLANPGSNASLWGGLHWLRDPAWLPPSNPISTQSDPRKLAKWQIGHLVSLRHFYLHGSKQSKIPIYDVLSFELPGVMVELAEKAMPAYWKLLKKDDGSQKWVERLADADIHPLVISGDKQVEKGLIDPDIVAYLDGRVDLEGERY
jgi:hypothetical protein